MVGKGSQRWGDNWTLRRQCVQVDGASGCWSLNMQACEEWDKSSVHLGL